MLWFSRVLMGSLFRQCWLLIQCLSATVVGTLAQPSTTLDTLFKKFMLKFSVRLIHGNLECFGNFSSFLHIYHTHVNMISVKPNLKPYLSSTSVQAILGSNATLQTLLVDANPMDVAVQWLGPSRELIPDSQYGSFNAANNHTVYTVTVANLTSSSEGVYTCEVENSIGTSAVNFTLLMFGETLLYYSNQILPIRITYSKGYLAFFCNSTTYPLSYWWIERS